MDEVGQLFQEEEYFVQELLMSGRAMKAAIAPLRPLLAAAGAVPAGVVMEGTVKGDLHDIGKNLVVSMLEGSGFKVIYLGADVTPAKFVDAFRTHKPQVLCLFALLTVTMLAMKSTIEAITAAGFNLINPVQCSAAGMDPQMLKDRYRGRLVFWGGGVDTQETLPFGTPGDVRRQVLERCEIFSPGGGFVFNAIHNVQAMTPTENVVAMIEALREFNGGG
jgi:methylmalonyl-CoA mutase cobalamin-binding subunit